jgi:transposase-like protein
MSRSVLNAKSFQSEEAAYKWIEARVWPNGPVCPHCGETKRLNRMQGKATRHGLFKCYACRKQFRVTVGTVFEASHVPMHLWLQAMYLMSSSKKGVSTNQLHRTLGVTLRTAWFMSHRLREAMRTVGVEPMGGAGEIVEADETYFGKIEGEVKHSRKRYNWKPTKGGRVGPAGKRAVVALVERGGTVRSFHVEVADKATVGRIVRENVAKESRLHTDESKLYGGSAEHFAAHETVKHTAKEYVRGDVHTNTVEGFFSVFKRGMRGVYQQCAEKHLHRYLAEFDFRYNNRAALGVDDVARTEALAKGIVGKRLTYRTIN